MAYTNISIVTLSSKTKSSFQCRGVLAGTGVRHSREARKTGKKLGEMRTFMYRSNYPAFTKEEIRYIIQSRVLRRCLRTIVVRVRRRIGLKSVPTRLRHWNPNGCWWSLHLQSNVMWYLRSNWEVPWLPFCVTETVTRYNGKRENVSVIQLHLIAHPTNIITFRSKLYSSAASEYRQL